MTLIARFRIEKSPLYVADLLLSSDGKTSSKVDIPAARDINSLLPADALRSVTGLRQKLNIIGDDLIVAWAGNYVQAYHIIKQIAVIVREGANWEDVNQLIAGLPPEDRDDLSVLGSIVRPVDAPEPGFHLQHFSYSFFKVIDGPIEITAAGSGREDLLGYVSQLLSSREFLQEENNPYRRAMMLGMAISAGLVGHETTTGQNILNWWGGALEVAILDKGRFRKVGNTLHTVWIARRGEQGDYEISLVPKFIKYDYLDDALVAQTFEMELREERGGVRARTVEHSYRAYTPLLRGPRDYNWKEAASFDLSHNILCCFLVLEGPKSADRLVHVHHSADGDTPLRLEHAGRDQFLFGYRADLAQALEAQVSQFTGRPARFSRIGY